MRPQQERFVAEYLIDLNATQAAIRAGYSAKTAEQIGYQLLQKTSVAQMIQQKQQKLATKLEVTAERIVKEYARLAFSDARRVMSWGPDGVRLRDSSELTDDEAATVAEVSESITKDGGSIKLKVHDKKGALDSLARHLGMFPEAPAASTTIIVPVQFVLKQEVKDAI